MRRRGGRVAPLALALLVSACSGRGTIVVNLTSQLPVGGVTYLRVRTENGGETAASLFKLPRPVSIPPLQTLALSFDASRRGAVRVVVEALEEDFDGLTCGASCGEVTPGQGRELTVTLGVVGCGGPCEVALTDDLAGPVDLRLDDAAAPDLEAPDLAVPDLAVPDLAPSDLRPSSDGPRPDLAPRPDLTPPLPAPVLASLAPSLGPAAGGLPVTLKGSGFQLGASVSFDGAAAVSMVKSAGEISATLPARAMAQGRVPVVIKNPDGQSATRGDLFSYYTLGFGAPMIFMAGKIPRGIVTADLNKDGFADLAVTSGGEPAVNVLLGNGMGGFQAPKGVPVAMVPQTGLAVADLNGDGKLDLVVVTNSPESEISVHLGNGDGSFVAPRGVYAGDAIVTLPVLADLDGDRKLDLAFGTAMQSLLLLSGGGDGSFGQPIMLDTGGVGAEQIAAADLDFDGRVDLVVAGSNSTKVAVLLGKVNRAFATALYENGTAVKPDAIVLTDLNRDLRPDVVLALPMTSLRALLGKGDGTLLAGQKVDAPVLDRNVLASADFNGDCLPDLALGTGDPGKPTSQLLLLVSHGDGTVQPATPLFSWQTSPGLPHGPLALADFNRDNRVDVAVTTPAGVAVALSTAPPLRAMGCADARACADYCGVQTRWLVAGCAVPAANQPTTMSGKAALLALAQCLAAACPIANGGPCDPAAQAFPVSCAACENSARGMGGVCAMQSAGCLSDR